MFTYVCRYSEILEGLGMCKTVVVNQLFWIKHQHCLNRGNIYDTSNVPLFRKKVSPWWEQIWVAYTNIYPVYIYLFTDIHIYLLLYYVYTIYTYYVYTCVYIYPWIHVNAITVAGRHHFLHGSALCHLPHSSSWDDKSEKSVWPKQAPA